MIVKIPERLECDILLDRTGPHKADLRYAHGRWERFDILEPVSISAGDTYVVPSLPFDVHCHGIGQYDFSDLSPSQLAGVDAVARQEGIFCIPTIFLRPAYFETFLQLMRRFADLRAAGELRNIPSIALEGPLLSTTGGTPGDASWLPSKTQWQQIADCGRLGLSYVVLSPDIEATGHSGRRKEASPSLTWIIETLVDAEVIIALGHFRRSDPRASAKSIDSLISQIERAAKEVAPPILTDHLFNDMPRRFKHAWRTMDEKARRAVEIQEFIDNPWRWELLDQQVGEVPAELLRAARDRRLTICLNFDGEHVDPLVCKAVVELLGPRRIIAMTDRIESSVLAGETLCCEKGTTLKCRDSGVVAAGSVGIEQQIHMMRELGIREESVWQMFCFAADDMLSATVDASNPNHPAESTLVAADRSLHSIYVDDTCARVRAR